MRFALGLPRVGICRRSPNLGSTIGAAEIRRTTRAAEVGCDSIPNRFEHHLERLRWIAEEMMPAVA